MSQVSEKKVTDLFNIAFTDTKERKAEEMEAIYNSLDVLPFPPDSAMAIWPIPADLLSLNPTDLKLSAISTMHHE